MIIDTQQFKEYASKILTAVDTTDSNTLTETLSLIAKNGNLTISVTNREYFVSAKIPVADDIDFEASVNAVLFLKLAAQITTPDIEFVIKGNTLVIKGNGTYKLPMICSDDGTLLELPKIEIHNVTKQFNIHTPALQSIDKFNSKIFKTETPQFMAQKYYYVDELGAITYVEGACVNDFTLDEPVRMLLSKKVVSLFKLFSSDYVKFTMGHDEAVNGTTQTKVRFENDEVTLTAILSCDDTLINRVPVTAIRKRANNTYNYNVQLSRALLLQAINRLSVFNGASNNTYVLPKFTFTFDNAKLTITDETNANSEVIDYLNDNTGIENEPYKAELDVDKLRGVIESCNSQDVQLSFGDTMAFVVTANHVKNVIPEK